MLLKNIWRPKGFVERNSWCNKINILFILLLTLPLLASCGKEKFTIHHNEFLVFGTLVDVTIATPPEQNVDAQTQHVQQLFQQMHKAFHAWEAGELVTLNEALAQGRTTTISDELLQLIQAAIPPAIQSEHLFNPAIGKLIGAWGFHREDWENTPLPDPDWVKLMVASHPTMEDLDIDGHRISSHNRDVELDFGAFAKGYGIELAMNWLKAQGIHNAIINAGGNLRAMGSKGDEPWRIGIAHPRKKTLLGTIEIQGDESLMTSGDYERFYIRDGKRYQHIIDPNTGFPAQGTSAVTVIHSNAGIADAASTALLIAGEKNWERIAKSMGIAYVLLMTEDGRLIMSPKMRNRVTLAE